MCRRQKKKQAGQLLNDLKQFAEKKFEDLKQNLQPQPSAVQPQGTDITLPGTTFPIGSRHPISMVRNNIVSIFKRLGFALAEGPEIEDDWHNFGAMNLPEDHPARDMQDTFLYKPKTCMASAHAYQQCASPRNGKSKKPPIRIICPGRVYRNETISARAHCFFTR